MNRISLISIACLLSNTQALKVGNLPRDDMNLSIGEKIRMMDVARSSAEAKEEQEIDAEVSKSINPLMADSMKPVSDAVPNNSQT